MTLLPFLRHRHRFCVNRKCSLERLLTKGQIWRPARWKYRPAAVHFRQSFACGAQVSPAARHFAPFSHALARGRLARRGGWRRRGGATDSCDGGVHGYTCASGLQWSLPGPPGPATAAAPKEKRAPLPVQARADRLQKGKSAQIAHAVGGSSTGVQHCRGLLLQAQGGETHRWYRPGRRQQLDHPVSGSRVGPDTDQSSSALLARRAKGSAAGCGSC